MAQENHQLMSSARVCATLDVGITTLYKLCRTGHLARPVKLTGTRRVAWRASDVHRYIDGLPPVELRAMPGGAA